MRSAMVSVQLGCHMATTNVALGKRSTAAFGDSTVRPSTLVFHNDELLSQNNTGWAARAMRRPRLPAPKKTTREELIEPLRSSSAAEWIFRVLPRLDAITDYCRLNTSCQGRE